MYIVCYERPPNNISKGLRHLCRGTDFPLFDGLSISSPVQLFKLNRNNL
jgi:hypothetical protein